MKSAVSPISALLQGLLDVLKAPLVVLAIAIVTLIIALPFAAALHTQLQESLSVQPQVTLAETEIDPEWWMEFREQARGLAATFTPAVLGFAAVLDGLSGVLDGERPATAIMVPFLVTVVACAFIVGGALQRFQQRRAIGIGGFVRAGRDHLLAFTAIAAAAERERAAVSDRSPVVVRAVHRALVAMTTTERDAFSFASFSM